MSRICLIPALASLLLVGAAGAQTVPASAQTDPTSTVTIRSLGPLPRAVQSLLTRFGQSDSVTVPAGADPIVNMRSRCGGSLTNDYLDDVQKLNKDFKIGPESFDRTVRLPPCVRVAKNQNVQVLPGDKSIDAITKRLLGVPANQNIQVCAEGGPKVGPFAACNLTAGQALGALNGGKPIKPTDLVPGRLITVPTVTWPTTIALKPGVDAKAIADQVTQAFAASGLQPGVEVAMQDADLRIIAPLTSLDEKVRGTACAEDSLPTQPWPFATDALVQRLKASAKVAASRNFLGSPAVVRVADTGFNGIGTFFPLAAIEVNNFDLPNQPYDKDKNSYIADVYGIDAENRGDLGPYADDRYRDHGTQVADMALGGKGLRQAFPEVSSLVKLSFAKIYWKRTGPITVKDDAIYQTMTHIANHADARVVNFSIGTSDRNSARMFVSTLRNAASLNLLAIIAAGNESNDISEIPTFPAAYGGHGSEVADRIITVGAIAPDGSLAPFSNSSQSRVDILAPGCRIPFSADGSRIEYLHGTSIAAPFVAFIAGSLHSLGIREMTRVKQRILVSANSDRSLELFTRLGGLTLNPERAISIFDDVVRIQGEARDRYWTWNMPEGGLKLCASGAVLNPWRLLSMSTYKDGDKLRVRILKAEFDDRTAEPIDCLAAEAQLSFLDEGGTQREVWLKEITALVPRYPFPKP